VNHVFLVVTGSSTPGPNPDLTEEALAEATDIRNLLPRNPSFVICGTGKRHLDLAHALGLKPTVWTPDVGGAEKMMHKLDGDMVVLADGTEISADEFMGAGGTEEMRRRLSRLGNDSIIITSRGLTKGILHIKDHPDGVTLIRLSVEGISERIVRIEFVVLKEATTS
jgi:hypothetical protein